MKQMISLQCPTCGARLDVAKTESQFTCAHCGNAFLFEKTVGETPVAERDHLSPQAIISHQLRQWLRVGNFEIFVHAILEEKENERRFIFVDVEYRNPGKETLSCRRNQWILYDAQGYTFDAASDSSLLEKRGRPPLTGERFVNSGMRVRGWVVFSPPMNVNLERLQFITGFFMPKTAEFILQK
ncbi:MAG: hypothetical protein Fur0022_05710 [Anaerolineales bacterium]